MANLIKKRESNLLPVLIIFIGIIAGYVYYTEVATVSREPIGLPETGAGSLSIFRSITFDFDIFNTTTFINLKVFGESPVDAGQTGKENIFSSF